MIDRPRKYRRCHKCGAVMEFQERYPLSYSFYGCEECATLVEYQVGRHLRPIIYGEGAGQFSVQYTCGESNVIIAWGFDREESPGFYSAAFTLSFLTEDVVNYPYKAIYVTDASSYDVAGHGFKITVPEILLVLEEECILLEYEKIVGGK